MNQLLLLMFGALACSPQVKREAVPPQVTVEDRRVQKANKPQPKSSQRPVKANPKKGKPKPSKRLTSGPQDIRVQQVVQGQDILRKVIIHAPNRLETTQKYPVVLALHGNGGAAHHWLQQFAPFINKDGWVGVYPQGLEKSWNLGYERSRADDVAFITKVVNRLEQYGQLDMSRLYVVGYSNGAGMAHKLAIETDHFQAIAAIVTSLTKENRPKKQTKPVSVLQIMGMQDKLIPYRGGSSRIRHHFVSAEESAKLWAQSNGCKPTPKKSKTRFGNQKIVYAGCKANKRVVHYGAPDAGHRIPRNFEGGLIKLSLDFFQNK